MDLIACVVSHCHADAALVALLGTSGQIGREFQRSVSLPQVYFSVSGGTDEGAAHGSVRLSVLVMARSPATCSAIHARLRQLFHMKSNYTMGAAPNTVRCYRSLRISSPDEQEYDDPAGREWQAFYDFIVTEPHGF